ncbi:hypothetical protein FH972_005051 [Carpinus fangiana]|uniref:Histidinol-phosphatase n=1 Tax=Carpinus fangiana TaxID=176857 RepID=A0A5N6QN24_9ROSI|nr:hypothetical protein FH972_005051 [Carpinus fangiana]
MITQEHILSQNSSFLFFSPNPLIRAHTATPASFLTFNQLPNRRSPLSLSLSRRHAVASNSELSNGVIVDAAQDSELECFAQVANTVADAAGEVIRKYFRKKFDIVDKEDLSPVTIADQSAEESMVSIILEKFPSHAIYGEENGWRRKEKFADYVWVLDPIDGRKSFITSIFLYIFEILSPLRYTTSPHLFRGDAVDAFARVRNKVKVPLYGCDCYAYALFASGFVDLLVESGLKPYDFLSLIPVIEGAGGVITDWKGNQLHWDASPDSSATSFNIVAARDKQVHQQAVDSLQWPYYHSDCQSVRLKHQLGFLGMSLKGGSTNAGDGSYLP